LISQIDLIAGTSKPRDVGVCPNNPSFEKEKKMLADGKPRLETRSVFAGIV
jgi:hypothetical protein